APADDRPRPLARLSPLPLDAGALGLARSTDRAHTLRVLAVRARAREARHDGRAERTGRVGGDLLLRALSRESVARECRDLRRRVRGRAARQVRAPVDAALPGRAARPLDAAPSRSRGPLARR